MRRSSILFGIPALVLIAATVVCGYATYVYCEYWWSNHLAKLAGRPITDVVLPIEIVGPIFQWMGVVSTVTIALVISFAITLASSWFRGSHVRMSGMREGRRGF